MMRWMQRGLVCVAMVLAVPVAAQQGPGRGRAQMQGPNPIGGLLQLQRTLELSEGQIEQLEALQQEIEVTREAQRAEASDFRQRVRDGDVTRSEIREWTEALREISQGMREAHRERIDGILNEEQRARVEELQQLRQRRGPAMGGRGKRARGQRERGGVRGGGGLSRGRGAVRGSRGRSRVFQRGRAFPGRMNRGFRRGRWGGLGGPPPS